MSEVDAERLAVSLRLVVARPWTRAGDVAAIGLRGRYVRGIRVTVDLARRKEEKPLHRRPAGAASACMFEQRAEAVHVRIHSLDRLLPVVGRRRDRGGVDDIFERAEIVGQRARYVVTEERKIGVVPQRVEPVRNTPAVVVENGDLDPLPLGDALVPVQRRLNEVARSDEHTSELQSLMRTSYAVFCLTKHTLNNKPTSIHQITEKIS